MTRIRHLLLAVGVLPAVALTARQRRRYSEMREFLRDLPAALDRPLSEALGALTPSPPGPTRSGSPVESTPRERGSGGEGEIRRLADVAALLERRSPLGLCLRRSLVRYHFLRRSGVPVVLHFGAKFKDGRPDREVTGHAWLTREGRPYYEDSQNYQGFRVILVYPTGEG